MILTYLIIIDRLWEAGFKQRYYEQKFGVELPDKEFQKKYAIPKMD